ncbi:MAG: tetratricopeptide repeat protein [Rhodocyclales bacterium]|nr:tetratricopeptide repeat protein [Rhodocyclales bacterium]
MSENATVAAAPDAMARHKHALALAGLGRYEDACLAWQEALRLDPGTAEAHQGLGVALLALGHAVGARASLANAMALVADDRVALLLGEMALNLPAAVARARRYSAGLFDPMVQTSESRHDSALVDQDDCATCFLQAVGFRSLGRRTEALAAARRALEQTPDDAALLGKLGIVFSEGGDLAAAADCHRASLERRPDHLATLINLADVHFRQGNTEASLLALEKCLALDEHNAAVRSALLLALSRSSKVGAASLYAAHRRYSHFIESPLREAWPAHGNSRDPMRRLNIGIVSADLRNHPMAYFLEPVLRHLAQSTTLALHAYSASATEDRTSQRMRGAFARWLPVANLSDAALAAAIQADGIDILIDLSGHTGGNRLPTLARKPAPLQASWIGYPCTTGLDAVDYYIGDDHFLPAGRFDHWFSEKIVRLPALVAFQPSPAAVAPNPLPAMAGKGLSFASFNHTSKITPETLDAWADVLRGVPDSRLLVFAPDPATLGPALKRALAAGGIAPERIDMRGRLPLSKYLLAHHQADICLDTVPYNGGTTTLHALSMGVPTLTLTGDTAPGCVGAALLHAVGLEGFTADTTAGLSAKARHWAAHLDALALIRQELPGRLAGSPIGRPEVIAASLERALRLMWQRWCEGLEPCAIRVGIEDVGLS